jgi:tetratricopeptide (TPR) repeat protein
MLVNRMSHLKKLPIICGAILGAVLGVPRASCSPRPPSPQSQAPTPADIIAAANDAYQAKDWGTAARLYGQITVQQPANGRAWYRLAVALDGQGQQDEAVAAFQKSIQAGIPAGSGEYGIALSYGSRQNNERAFEYLEKAAQDGFSDSARLAADVVLASLRTDSRFAKVAEQVKRNAKPCAYNPLNRQFDFWVGEWEVVTADGANPAGSSRIELILGDCVIQENWTSGGNTGYEGKSYNIYNPDLHRWEQFWNDNAGGMIHFYGELKSGVMDYWTDEIPQKDGTKLKRHLQFIPASADKVRQFSQGSTDGGKTWHVEYDFIYNRRK